jgi:hypothetical protein
MNLLPARRAARSQFCARSDRNPARSQRVLIPGSPVVAAVWDFRGGLVYQRIFWDTAAGIDPGAAASILPLIRQLPAGVDRPYTQADLATGSTPEIEEEAPYSIRRSNPGRDRGGTTHIVRYRTQQSCRINVDPTARGRGGISWTGAMRIGISLSNA